MLHVLSFYLRIQFVLYAVFVLIRERARAKRMLRVRTLVVLYLWYFNRDLLFYF